MEVTHLEKKTTNTDFMMQAGPYSHIVEAGGFIFLSGIDPMDIQKGLICTDDIEKATEIVMENMKKSLESVGSSLEKVVKVTIFMRDMADFAKLNGVYARYFTGEFPARTCVAVKEVPGNFQLKLEAIAIK
jgi:2-iminobutanoate/2-iminopropanoate deaminase